MVGLLIPKKSAVFTGTGDLFTAVYLAWSEHGVKVCIHVSVDMCVCGDVHMCVLYFPRCKFSEWPHNSRKFMLGCYYSSIVGCKRIL